MLVLMRAGSDGREIDAVRDRAHEAGLETALFTDDGRSVIEVSGEIPADLKGALAALPGVDLVVRRAPSEPMRTRDLRIESIRPLVPPAILLEELPLPAEGAERGGDTRGQGSRTT